ncbi:hypothetical protein D9M71_456580 [compost metagenome]
MIQCRQQTLLQLQRGADVDGRGNDVVAALPAVDLVVGVDRATQATAGEGRHHLVGVHVRAGARAGLEHIDREVLQAVLGQQFLAGGDDGAADFRIDLFQRDVGPGGSRLGQQQGADERQRHALAADREVVHRTLGLRPIQRGGGHRQFTHAVAFDTAVSHSRFLLAVRGNSGMAACPGSPGASPTGSGAGAARRCGPGVAVRGMGDRRD